MREREGESECVSERVNEGGREGGREVGKDGKGRCKNLWVVRERECSSPCVVMYCSDMYLSVGEHEKALEIIIMAENGWIDRLECQQTLYGPLV